MEASAFKAEQQRGRRMVSPSESSESWVSSRIGSWIEVKLRGWRVSRTKSRISRWDSLRSGEEDCLDEAREGAAEEGRGGWSSIVTMGDQGREA